MQQDQKNGRMLLLGILLGAVGLILICGLLIVFFSGDPTDDLSQVDTRSTDIAGFVNATVAAKDAQIPITAPTEPAQTIAPTIPPEPTRTAAPTYTAQVAIVADPTSAVTPTQTGAPAQDATEAAYLEKIVEMSIGCQEGLYGIAEQSEKASDNTMVMFETEWKVDMAVALLNVDQYCVGMRNVTPVPPRFATLHDYVGLMSEEMEQMVDDFTYGVDNMDAGRIISATEHMQKGTEYVEKMGEEMERLNR